MSCLLICEGPPPAVIQKSSDLELWSYADLSRLFRQSALLRHLGGYEEVSMVMPHLWLRPRPLLAILAIRLLSKGRCYLMDSQGATVHVNLSLMLSRALKTLCEGLRLPFLLAGVDREVAELNTWAEAGYPMNGVTSTRPLYLKTDLWFSTQVGGSVTHMAGVANHLAAPNGLSPLVFATAVNPLLENQVPFSLILPDYRFWDFREVPALCFSRKAYREILNTLGNERPSFIYQRYSLNNYAAVLLARACSVPLVTEYNGSEVWISKHWGRPVAFPKLSAKIEALNLRAAHLIVVVSNALRDELISLGIKENKILVNPNGVDSECFNPAISSPDLQLSLGIEGKTVIGFIGTFGPWHGTEVLIEAFAQLLNSYPGMNKPVHLLLVGEGARYDATMEQAKQLGLLNHCTFTGQIPQKEAPRYLGCCDILVAPHVPNPDGSAFFGSPMKIFEYMSMGRPIISSRLGQMQDILKHGQTAWLVEPAKVSALASGLAHLLQNPELSKKLGDEARKEVLQHYTWSSHVEKIIKALGVVCS